MSIVVSKSQSYMWGILLVVLATIGSSLSGIFVRLVPELDGWQIACWRGYWMSVSLLIYLVLCYGSGIGDAFRAIPRTALLAVALFFTISSTAYVTALTLTSVANVSALGALSTIFTAFLSFRVTGERVSAIVWIAAPLALLGVATIMRAMGESW